MPLNPKALGAPPARFRRQRVLIVGCGDIGLRVLKLLKNRVRVLALTSDAQRLDLLRAAGATPLRGDLDAPSSLLRLAGLAQRVLHLAPPPSLGTRDTRTRHLVRALRLGAAPRSAVYASTSGVYGDCQGAWVPEWRALRPATARAQRRQDAERCMRAWRPGVRVSVLRVPGIYAADRPQGTPRARLQAGMAALRAEDDVYTNHIHADDLARACLRALWRGAAQRIYHVSDDSDMKMGEYLDLAADLYGLPRAPRLDREAIAAKLSPLQMSFLRESRRLVNTRMKRELGLRLRYATVRAGLAPAGG